MSTALAVALVTAIATLLAARVSAQDHAMNRIQKMIEVRDKLDQGSAARKVASARLEALVGEYDARLNIRAARQALTFVAVFGVLLFTLSLLNLHDDLAAVYVYKPVGFIIGFFATLFGGSGLLAVHYWPSLATFFSQRKQNKAIMSEPEVKPARPQSDDVTGCRPTPDL